jgi:hypothetical protein
MNGTSALHFLGLSSQLPLSMSPAKQELLISGQSKRLTVYGGDFVGQSFWAHVGRLNAKMEVGRAEVVTKVTQVTAFTETL